MGAFMLPAMTSTSFGFGVAVLGVVLAFAMKGLRQVSLGGQESDLQPAAGSTEK
jgi:ENTS family enterobactin (siderophore) exporter